VPKLNEVTNPETCAKVMQLQALQALFLASMETRRNHKGNSNNHYMHQMYDILWNMTISPWQAHKPDQPLFHAIHPMATKDGLPCEISTILLPQSLSYHCLIGERHLAGLASLIATTPSLIG